MKKLISLGAPAFLAVAMTLPLSAAVLGGSGVLGGNASASGDRNGASASANGNGNGSVNGSAGDRSGSLSGSDSGSAGGSVSHNDNGGSVNGEIAGDGSVQGTRSVTPQAMHTPRATSSARSAASRADRALRTEYRPFSRRLTKVDQRITKAQQDGRITADEAARQRQDVQAIRDRFKKATDTSAQDMTSAEKAQMEADVKAQEEAAGSASSSNQ